MILKTIRHALSLCLLFSTFGIAVMGLSKTDGSKYAVKTIKTADGDIYDCIDFYKQPAFDHPLLKNHCFHPQMRPSFQPQRIRTTNVPRKMNATAAGITPLPDGGCPQGTVTIRRMNSATEYFSGTIIALGQTKSDPSKVYNGVGALISVYKPRVFPSQFSSAEIIIKSGPDSIIAGWTVNPHKYRDDQTRFFIISVYILSAAKVNQEIYQNMTRAKARLILDAEPAGVMHFFNSECGFVIYRPDIPLDFKITPVSKRGDDVYVFKFFIFRDKGAGVWWLEIGMDDPKITLGFWPEKIFSNLRNPATDAACGGEAFALATESHPEMGAGYFSDADPFVGGDAYCTDFVVVNESNNIVDAADTESYGNNYFYGVFDKHTKTGQHVVTFGGPN